jgi:DNA polymerase-3 subunit delta'
MIFLLASLPQLDIPRLHALGEKLSRASAAPAFRVLTDLIGWWLTRMVRANAANEPAAEVVPGEAALMRRLVGARGLEQWVGVWENLNRLFARADGLALDRKQVVLNAFSALERAARP